MSCWKITKSPAAPKGGINGPCCSMEAYCSIDRQFAPELPGIGDIAGKRFDTGALRIGWQQRISRRLELDFIETSLPEAIVLQAERFRQKFSSTEWTCRR